MSTDDPSRLASPSSAKLGPLPERANLPPQIGRLLKPGQRFGQPVYSAEQMHAYAAQEVAAERERWKQVAEAMAQEADHKFAMDGTVAHWLRSLVAKRGASRPR